MNKSAEEQLVELQARLSAQDTVNDAVIMKWLETIQGNGKLLNSIDNKTDGLPASHKIIAAILERLKWGS